MKLEAAISNGAHEAIDYSKEPVEEAVKRLTAGEGVQVVLDPVGIEQASVLRCLAHGGKLLIAGFAGGSIPAYAANRILLKGCSVIGVRAGEAGRQDPALRRREVDAVLALAAQGLARPFVSARFPLPEWVEAMRLLESRKAIGRVALEMDAA
jgi:NADPH:quinone reductase